MIDNFSLFSIPRRFDIIIETKDGDGSLLTLEAFAEMVEVHERIFSDVWHIKDEFRAPGGAILMKGGDPAYYPDICKKHYPTQSDLDEPKKNTVDQNVSA